MEIVVTTEQARVPVTILHLKGSVDSASSEAFLEYAKRLIEGGARNLVIDLSGVDFMSSAGLRVIHEIFDMLIDDTSKEAAAKVRQGIRDGSYKSPHLKLLNPNDKVKDVLDVFGYDMFLEIHPTLEKALDSF
jgi:anti-anti-sigma factor